MSWTSKKALQQIALGEDSGVEFKEVANLSKQRNNLADELAAMGNGDGGTMFFSVSDDGTVQTLTRIQMDELEKTICEICADAIKPILPLTTQRINVGDKFMLVVDIKKSEFVHQSPNGYFYRHGSSKRKIPPGVLERLMNQRRKAGFIASDEMPITGTGINTLDSELTQRFLTSRTNEPHESLLSKLGFVREDDAGVLRATVAGVLLCTNNPEDYIPNALISAVRYRGNTPDSNKQLDATEITGPLDRQIKDAVTFAVRNMQVTARKTPARVNIPQYSERAMFEAIVNAVTHRDYEIHGARIRLFLFDDCLELYSPGGLPNTLTVNSIRDRQHTRNEVLVSMLSRLSVDGILGHGERQYFMERRGEGVPIIYDETNALTGRKPEYELLDSELRLTLPAAPQKIGNVSGEVYVNADGKPIKGASVLALYPNKTCITETTDSYGLAHLEFHSELPMTVFCAIHGYVGQVLYDWNPKTSLRIDMHRLPLGGSIIFTNCSGHIPGISGRLNPILDNLDRTYLYADNISIDGGKQHPVHFKLGHPVQLTDVNGNQCIVHFTEMIGDSVLVEYESK